MKKIFLSDGQVTLVSDEDHIFLAGFNWSLYSGGYARTRIDGKQRHMHRVIVERMGLDLSKGGVDHIDGNGLNNQRNNLRIATRSQNMANCRKNRNNKSGYKGVSWHKARQKWQARIMFTGQAIHLGYFDDPKEASNVYCEAAEYYFEEFANF